MRHLPDNAGPMLRRHSIALWITLTGTTVSSLAAGTAIGLNWSKSEVIPVVLVKPGIGGFVPTEGSSIGNTWSKDEVKPVLLVKPGIGGFEPVEGLSIGNTWSKEQIVAVALTQPSVNGFSAMEFSEADNVGSTAASAVPAVIESQIDGDFNGWEGETVIRLTNGQIWKQSAYYYEYHYAFMPKVLILESGAIYKAKVEGTEESVAVIRLK
jgi:hypothetical protein